MSHQSIQVINMSEPLVVDAQVQYESIMKSVQVETDKQQKICFVDVAVGDDVRYFYFIIRFSSNRKKCILENIRRFCC
jgi:hypothetical protein